jgi:hypothetical protein
VRVRGGALISPSVNDLDAIEEQAHPVIACYGNGIVPDTGAFTWPVHFTEKKFVVVGTCGEPLLQLKSTVASVRVSTGEPVNGLASG